MDITSKVLREQHYNGVKHEKKVKFKLAELFREESSRPKKLKVDSGGDAGMVAAVNFLKKIENQVDRDPTKVTYSDIKLEEWQKVHLSCMSCLLNFWSVKIAMNELGGGG